MLAPLVFASLLLTSVASLGHARVTAQKPAAVPDSAAYLLVIDHSGSMREDAVDGRGRETGKSRWVEMQERAIRFVERLPLESRLWIAVFSDDASEAKTSVDTLNTEADRRRVIQRIRRGYGRPDGKTALYDTLGMAFAEAARLSKETPGRFVSVLVYTDGADTTSRRFDKAGLKAQFRDIVQINDNAWCIQVPLGGAKPGLDNGGHIVSGEPKIPIPVRITPGSVRLPSPRRAAAATARLRLSQFEKSMDVLARSKLRFAFVPDPGSGIDVEVVQPEQPLVPGELQLALRVRNAGSLAPEREYGGQLTVQFPRLRDYALFGTGSIRVVFEKLAAPPIAGLRPASGSVFPARQPIVFVVQTRQGADVLWDFGDDSSDAGERVVHTYHAPGKKRVTVSVQMDAGEPKTTGHIDLEILDVAVSVDRLTANVWQGAPHVFTCTGRGGLTRYEWVVDGKVVQGGGAAGERLTMAFLEPGQHTLVVRGHHPKTTVESDALKFEVGEKPALQLVEPQQGARLPYDTPLDFRATLGGPVRAVRWIVRPAAGADPIAELERPVEAGSSRFQHRFDEASGLAGARVEAVAVLEDGVRIAPPSASVEIALAAPERTLRITAPALGSVLGFDVDTAFEAEVGGPGVEAVVWTVRDKAGKQLASRRAPVDERGRARLVHRFAGDADQQCVIEARGVLDGGEAPAARAEYWVRHPEIAASIEVVRRGRFDTPVELALRGGDTVERVVWDFGDGTAGDAAGSSRRPTHVYGKHGRFAVRAELVGKGGKRATARAVVEIPLTPPLAVPVPRVGGEPVSRMAPGETLELHDESGGDVARREWFLDGEPVAPGKRSLVLDAEGRHVLALKVFGPPGANGEAPLEHEASVEITVVQYDHMLFALGAIGALLLLLASFRQFSKNQPQGWQLEVAETEDGYRVPFSLARYWSRTRKEARVPLGDLFPTKAQWTTGNRAGEVLVVRRGSRRQGGYQGVVKHPREGGDLRLDAIPGGAERKRWVLYDDREPLGDCTEAHIELDQGVATGGVDLLAKVLTVVVCGAAVYLLYSHVYSGI